MENFKVGFGVFFVEEGNLAFLFLDELLVSEGLVLVVSLGLLEFFPGQVQILFKLQFPFGQFVVFTGLGLD